MRLMKNEQLASRQKQQLPKKEPDGVRKLQGMLALIAPYIACRLSGLSRLHVSSAHHVLIFHFSIAPIFCLPLVHRLRLVERQQKEQAYGHMNAVKIHNQWRRIMRMAKTEELKQDIEILSQSYDRTVDRKDALIQVHRQLQLHTTSIHIYLAHSNAYSCPPLRNLMCVPKLIVHHMHVNAVITDLHVGAGQGS